MAGYRIDNIKFSEVSDFEFTISYTYKGIPFSSPYMVRTISKGDVALTLENQIELYLQKRDDDNYEALKVQFNGKSNVIIPDVV